MFEQQQNTGKSASLAEKYANAVGQLSDANDRAAHAEHDLQVERITRQDLIDEEVARRVAEAEERIRKELEAQLADKAKELEERNKALDKRESDVDKKAETIAQNISEQVRQQMSAAKTRFEKTALNRCKYPLNAVLHISKKCCTFIRLSPNTYDCSDRMLPRHRYHQLLAFIYLISIKSKYIRRVFNGLSETIPLYDFSCSSVLNIKSKPFFL